jgi:hypothetical protein
VEGIPREYEDISHVREIPSHQEVLIIILLCMSCSP